MFGRTIFREMKLHPGQSFRYRIEIRPYERLLRLSKFADESPFLVAGMTRSRTDAEISVDLHVSKHQCILSVGTRTPQNGS